MRKSVALSSNLSPYAKALKQVAVRGAAALGPTAREQELQMYAAGTLPADYKPPVQGQWDDTVERWAYSWQYPALEEAEETDAYRISQDAKLLGTLRDFAGYLAANPIDRDGNPVKGSPAAAAAVGAEAAAAGALSSSSAVGGGGESFMDADREAALLRALEEEGLDGLADELDAPSLPSAASSSPVLPGEAEAEASPQEEPNSAIEVITAKEDDFLAQLDAASRAVGGTGAHSIVARDEATGELITDTSALLRSAAMEPVKTTVEHVPAGIPAAYIYDGSHLSKLSIRFGQVLADDLGLGYDEEGITTALQALAYANMPAEARQLFTLASRLGFAMNATMFNALLYADAQLGNINPVMAGIEEMKGLGITPVRNTWHLLMLGFSKAKDYGAVSQVCDNMKAYANIEPDEATFALQLNALASDRTKENNVAEAIQLFDQMENVYGYVAGRPHYHALMRALATKRQTAMRERLELMGTKMEMLGIPWNPTTYTIQMRSAQLWGDTARIKKLFAKLRDDGLPARPTMYAWAIRAYANEMKQRNFEDDFRQKQKSPVPYLVDQLTLCYSMYALLAKRADAAEAAGAAVDSDSDSVVTTHVVDALLFAASSAVMLAMEHAPDDTEAIMKFEQQAAALWDREYDARGVERTVYSHHVYISMLAHQQRIDEAERLFQDIVLRHDQTPLPKTYEVLMFMHLASGEEGGTARALQYMEAMERSKMPIAAATLKQFVKINNEAGYKRDMKRRARRIMQAREEYMARQRESAPFADQYADSSAAAASSSASPSSSANVDDDDHNERDTISTLAPNPTMNAPQSGFEAEASPSQQLEERRTMRSEHSLKPLPIDPNSTLAWWHKWRKESASKHELFPVEGEDGMPRGESDADRQLALTAMGIAPVPKEELPDPTRHRLLPKLLKEEGSQPAGALWALDGGDLSYPSDGGGPQGWGVQLWRERKLLEKEHQKALEGRDGASLADFSTLGTGARVANDQLAIEEAGLKGPGELADYRQYPNHLYDDGTLKPASEMAHHVSPSAELVWRQEAADPLSPFKAQDELSLEAENVFFSDIQLASKGKIQDAIAAIKAKEEASAEVVGSTLARRGKHDYLDKWREMYSHGTLEVPDEPIAQFGRTVPVGGAAGGDLSQSIRAWYRRNRKTPAVGASAGSGGRFAEEQRETVARRQAERAVSEASAEEAKDRKRFRERPSSSRRRRSDQ